MGLFRCGMHRARREPDVSWRRAIDQVPRKPDQQVLGQGILVKVLLDHPVLPGRQPMPDMGSEPRHLGDGLEHLDALEISAVEPPKVRRARLDRLPVNELHHRFHPPQIAELIEPALVGLLDAVPAEEAL